MTYDAASNMIQSINRSRYHNAIGTGPLGNPSSITQPQARVSYQASYPDALGRTQASAGYGTNGGNNLSRPATIPARSDSVLVSSQTYDATGQTATSIDPAGMVSCYSYDARGRELQRIGNCIGSSSSSSSSSSSGGCAGSDDTNVTVRTSYNADGNVASITAVNAATGDQVTQYVYGTTLSDSAIASSLLKSAEIYPDSVSGSDQIEFTYNRQGQLTTLTDQTGTVHSYLYDALGRTLHDAITTVGTGVDGTVRRLSTTYDVRGMTATRSSYNNPSPGSGSVLNQSQFVYNDFAQLVTEYQSHSGAVNVSTTVKTQYSYSDGSANTIRPTSLVYPNGRTLTYSYGTTNSQGDRLSRIASLIDDDGTTHLVDYTYLGLGSFVEGDRPQPKVTWSIITDQGGVDPDTGDIYRGLDRFGRVKDNQWFGYGSGSNVDLDRIQYGYDRASNRIWRKNPVATGYGKEFDEIYTYDGIHRLKQMARGTLNGSQTALTNSTFGQCWTLDSTGNWSGFRQADSNATNWNLIQSRSANPVNEITGITNSLGAGWAQPAYSPAGNMTTIPQPNDPTKSYTTTYDAWNRLVTLVDTLSSNTVSEYQYDANKRRIVQKSYTAGTLSETRHFYYTAQWQTFEERLGTTPDTASPDRQFVWGLRYIDDLILRDRDTGSSSSSSGTGPNPLGERLFVIQDANWNVTSLLVPAGPGLQATIIERFAYSAYGVPIYLSSAFAPHSSATNFEHLFCGYRFEPSNALYHIRHRIYQPLLGVWFTRDPIGYRSGLHLTRLRKPLRTTDPFGLIEPGTEIPVDEWFEGWKDGNRGLTSDDYRDIRKNVGAGCVGLSSLMIGHGILTSDPVGKSPSFENCFSTQSRAEQEVAKMEKSKSCCGSYNQYGEPAKPKMFAVLFHSDSALPVTADGKVDMTTWNGTRPPNADNPTPVPFDFGYIDPKTGLWLHANHGEDEKRPDLIMKVKYDSAADFFGQSLNSTAFCVVCEDWQQAGYSWGGLGPIRYCTRPFKPGKVHYDFKYPTWDMFH